MQNGLFGLKIGIAFAQVAGLSMTADFQKGLFSEIFGSVTGHFQHFTVL